MRNFCMKISSEPFLFITKIGELEVRYAVLLTGHFELFGGGSGLFPRNDYRMWAGLCQGCTPHAVCLIVMCRHGFFEESSWPSMPDPELEKQWTWHTSSCLGIMVYRVWKLFRRLDWWPCLWISRHSIHIDGTFKWIPHLSSILLGNFKK